MSANETKKSTEKKEWETPDLTVLEIELETMGGAPPGSNDGTGYS